MASNSISVQRSISRRRKPLAAAYVWLLLFMVIYCARPEDWIPGLWTVPLAKLAGILAFTVFVLTLGKVHPRFPLEVIYLVSLFGGLCLSVLFSPVWRGGAFWTVVDFSKVVPIAIVMALVTVTLKRLRYLLFTQAASVAIIALVSVWKGRSLGGRLEGVLGGIYSNPNELALSIAINLPLCLAFLFATRNGLWKVVWAITIFVMTSGIFLTSSRAGFISLIVATAVCLWEFAIRGRRRYLVGVVALAGVGFAFYATHGVMSRWSSKDESARESAQERQELLVKSLKVTAEHPLFGVGPGNFAIISGHWRVTHNSYTQMSSEGGVPALLLYLLILWRGFANVQSIKRMARGRGELSMLASGLRASLFAFIVGSFFASVAYHFFTYFLVMYTVILYRIARREATANTDSQRAKFDEPARETVGDPPLKHRAPSSTIKGGAVLS